MCAKTVLQAIWSDFSQGLINAAILPFRKRLQACIKAAGGHFEHAVSIDAISINMSWFFKIIKTVSISCN